MSKSGTLLYEANPNLYEVILNVLREREQKMLGGTLEACKKIRKLTVNERSEWKISPTRVQSLEAFVDFAQGALGRIVKLDRVEFDFVKNFIRKNCER